MVVDSSAACAEIHDLKLRNSTENDKLTHLCPSTKTFSCEREAFNWKMCPQFHMRRINGKNYCYDYQFLKDSARKTCKR